MPDELIAQGKLNEALILLEEYIRRNPEDFDNAQKRIDRIFKLRATYTGTAEELLDVIVNEPLNDEKKLRLISQLENYENDPTEIELKFIDETKIASQFTYYRALFDTAMNEGSRLIAEKRFTEAARRFAAGLVLYRDEFYAEFAGSVLLSQTDTYLEQISGTLAAYENLQSKLVDTFKKFNSSLTVYDIDGSLSAYKAVDSVLREYAAVRNIPFRAGIYFKTGFEQLKEQNPDLTEASFLPFAYRLLLGRGSGTDTGIVQAMDRQWDVLCSESRFLLTAFIEKYSGDIAAFLSVEQDSPSFAFATNVKNTAEKLVLTADMGKDFVFLYSLLEQPAGTSAMPSFYAAYNSALDYNKTLMLGVQKFFDQKDSFNSAKEIYDKISVPPYIGLQQNQGLASYANSLISYANRKFDTDRSCITDMRVLNVMRDPLRSVDFKDGNPEFSLPPWEKLYAALSHSLEVFSQENIREGIRAWENLSSFVAKSSDFIREKYTLSYNESIALINENSDSDLAADPTKALTALQKLKGDLNEELKSLSVRFDLLSQAPEEPVIKNPGSALYAENSRNAFSDFDFFRNLSTRIDTSSQLAQRRIAAAQQAKNEADFRYSQALAALQREDFDVSRESLQQARNKYNESLLYQNSETLRTQTDAKLSALGADIVRLENSKVVRDVRMLITNARSLYYNGDFEQAERLVLQAEDRWAVTNVEQNSEVVNLKALIGNALSVRTGRYVPVTDPLYPEISQMLNVAYQYFEQGSRKIVSGNRTAGLELLTEAREKIKDVQVLYPLNQEANLLALRISKVINPADFEEHFKQRYNNAKNEYGNPSTKNRAYADLKDLYEINSGYPGLKQLIYTIEVELGIVIPPPDPKKIARSKQLVTEAVRLYESNARDEATLNSALNKLDEALTLNPENTEATVLLDRIKTGMGGQSLVVLPADKEMLYQQAVQELSKGNTITAAAIVANLWQDLKLRRSAKIIDLKNKVDSLL